MTSTEQLIEEAVKRYEQKFANYNNFDSSSQFAEWVRGKLYQEFEAFLRTELSTIASKSAEEQRAEFARLIKEILIEAPNDETVTKAELVAILDEALSQKEQS